MMSLKKMSLKNKRTAIRIWSVSFFALAWLSVHILSSYMSIDLVMNFLPFLSSAEKSQPMFYGENIDMSQILPSSQHYVINSKGQDLIDIAASLGINLIRLTNGQRGFDNNTDVYTKKQWDQVLNKMQKKGIKALILVEAASNNADYYSPDIRPAYLHLVQEYVDSGVFSHPDVYAVDIKNEPLLTDANISMLQAARAMIKVKYPHLKQTIGWWATPISSNDPYNPDNYNWSDYSTGKKLANIVDFYSIHMYGELDSDNLKTGVNANLRAKVFLSRVESGLRTTKPILIEEFGEANGEAVSDQNTIRSPQLQANIYQGVYQTLEEMHSRQIIGVVAFDFYSRNQYSDAWAIIKNNGNYLFPAAYILQEYALGKGKKSSLQATTILTSQSYLAKNADNNTTENIHVADRVGLKIELSESNAYTLSLNTQNRLRALASFHYDPISHTYQAVYLALNKGSVQLNVFLKSSCTKDGVCTTAIYTLTINVH